MELKNPHATHVTHGLTGTRVYKTWESMKARCYNKNDEKYPLYGGRGITVCEEWLGKDGAGNFAKWAYGNGFKEEKHQTEQSIDRIDVNGNYCPENCRFVNAKVQANNRQNTIWIEYNGKNRPLQDWAEIIGVKEGTIRWRLNKGWSLDRVLSNTVRKKEKISERMLNYHGETKKLKEWAKIKEIEVNVLSQRIRRGWSVERALETITGDDKWHKTKTPEVTK